MGYEEIVRRVAGDLALPERFVDRVYRSFWKAVRQHIKSLPLKQELTDEEFLRLQPNVNIPSIGKLYVTLDRYHRMKRHNELVQERIKNRDNNVEDNQD